MKRQLLETVRVHDGVAPLWPLHLQRVERSCAALSLTIPALIEPRGGADRVVRLAIRTVDVEVTERPVDPLEGLALVCSPAVHLGYPHKLADRAWLDAARTTVASQGGDDALLFDTAGRLIEATRWAIGWWENDTLTFPPLALGGLPSVARVRLSQLARGGIGEGELQHDAIHTRSLLACNAARGVVRVTAVDGVPSLVNHRTEALGRRFWAV